MEKENATSKPSLILDAVSKDVPAGTEPIVPVADQKIAKEEVKADTKPKHKPKRGGKQTRTKFKHLRSGMVVVSPELESTAKKFAEDHPKIAIWVQDVHGNHHDIVGRAQFATWTGSVDQNLSTVFVVSRDHRDGMLAFAASHSIEVYTTLDAAMAALGFQKTKREMRYAGPVSERIKAARTPKQIEGIAHSVVTKDYNRTDPFKEKFLQWVDQLRNSEREKESLRVFSELMLKEPDRIIYVHEPKGERLSFAQTVEATINALYAHAPRICINGNPKAKELLYSCGFARDEDGKDVPSTRELPPVPRRMIVSLLKKSPSADPVG